MSYNDSIVLVQSQDVANSYFGTGFVFHQNSGSVFVLTCAHVVEDVGGRDSVQIQGMPAKVVAIGKGSLDVAVLSVEGMYKTSILKLKDETEGGKQFVAIGYQKSAGYLLRSLHGCVGEEISFYQSGKTESYQIKAWELIVEGGYTLERGYSGSPVIDEKTGNVLAIVSQRVPNGKSGRAISVEAIAYIWNVPDIEKVHSALLKLGYQEQAKLFSRLARKHLIAAFLIHGPCDHGQKWLLNRLISQHIPQSLTTNPITISLGTKSRRNMLSSLWRELGGSFGLHGSSAILKNIIVRVHEAWRTRHVLIIMESVHLIPEFELKKIINDFWLPLVEECQGTKRNSKGSKLYIFFVDYEGVTGEWELPFVEKIDVTWKPQVPIKSPKLTHFVYKDLEDWIIRAEEDLPMSVVDAIDDAVEDILSSSDGGVPEFVLEELCRISGFNWYEVRSNWLRL